MDDAALPSVVVELVRSFVGAQERVGFYLKTVEKLEDDPAQEESGHTAAWITTLCTPTPEDVELLVPDRGPRHAETTEASVVGHGAPLVDVHEHPVLVRLLLYDDAFKNLRSRKLSLADALTIRLSKAVEDYRADRIIHELIANRSELSLEDRARSFVLLVEDTPDRSASWSEAQIPEWLDLLAEGLASCPQASRPQLLTAASTSGHASLVTLLLDDTETASLDGGALEADCLVQAVRNGHIELVRWLVADERFTRRSEGWHAIVRALEVSCVSGDLGMTEVLVPHYAPLCSSVVACASLHPYLLHLALEHHHLDVAKTLLMCDPRGAIRHVDRLVAALRDNESGTRTSVLVAILANQEEDANGWPVKWDATALQQAISMHDSTLVGFLMDHVEFSRDTLMAALDVAKVDGKQALVGVIGERVQASGTSPISGDTSALTSPVLVYADGDAVMAQKRGSLSFWPGIIHRCWLNGTYDVRFEADCDDTDGEGLEPLTETELSSSAIRPRPPVGLKPLRAVATHATGHILAAAMHAVMNSEGGEPPSDTNEERGGTHTGNLVTDTNNPCSLGAEENLAPNEDADATVEVLRKVVIKVVGQMVSEEQQMVLVQEANADTPSDATPHELGGVLPAVECLDGDTCVSLDERNDLESPPMTTPTADGDNEATANDELPYPEPVTSAGDDNNDEDAAGLDDSLRAGTPTFAEYSDDLEERSETGAPVKEEGEEVEASEKQDNDAASFESETLPPTESPPTGTNVSVATTRSGPWRAPQPALPSSLTLTTPSVHPIISCPVNWTSSTTNAPITSSALAFTAAGQFCEGNRVEVRHKGRADYFPGVIAFCHTNGGLYDVVYDNGEEEACVAWEYIRVPSTEQSVDATAADSGANTDADLSTTTADNHQLLAEISNLSSITSGSSGFSLLAADLRLGQSSSDGPSTDSLERQYAHLSIEQLDDSHLGEGEQKHRGTRSGLSLSSTPESSDFFPASTTDTLSEQCCTPTNSDDSKNSPEHTHEDQSKEKECDESWGVKPLGVSAHTTSSTTELVTIMMHSPTPSPRTPVGQQRTEHVVAVDQLPEIPTILVPTPLVGNPDPKSPRDGGKESAGTVRHPSRTVQLQHQKARGSVSTSANTHADRGRTADSVSSQELAEWRNVDLLFNRKRRLLQAQTGSVESTKLPWGEEFATIQSLKRFAAQHPDVLREHIEGQLSELRAPLASNSPGKKKQASPVRCSSSHSGAGQARESLLLFKDLAFLLKHRLATFFDAILPVVLPIVFNAEQRFLCETAYEVLEAMVLHCSDRKLALLLLQLGETYAKHEDLRLLNLTSVYVEKCFRNWSTGEILSLRAVTTSASQLLTLLADLLVSKSASARISAQRSVVHLRRELGSRVFEAVVRSHVPPAAVDLVLQQGAVPNDAAGSPFRRSPRSAQQQRDGATPTIVHSSPSILQRMLLQRQNRVLPSQT